MPEREEEAAARSLIVSHVDTCSCAPCYRKHAIFFLHYDVPPPPATPALAAKNDRRPPDTSPVQSSTHSFHTRRNRGINPPGRLAHRTRTGTGTARHARARAPQTRPERAARGRRARSRGLVAAAAAAVAPTTSLPRLGDRALAGRDGAPEGDALLVAEEEVQAELQAQGRARAGLRLGFLLASPLRRRRRSTHRVRVRQRVAVGPVGADMDAQPRLPGAAGRG